jgi:PPE-repeat protein
MLDFGLLPPEINSALMYSGPGSGPLLAAATAWEGLAGELHTTAASYGSAISGLTSGPWQGPASASMAAAVVPHLAWLSRIAWQAEQAATQAAAAASAYEAAFAATVPPPVIAANRALLMALLATNIFGQNTPAIAATEAEYAQMWAQDAATMYSYAGASAAASTLTPYTEPAPATSAGGLAAQGAAVAQAVGTSAGADTQGLSALTTALPGTLSGLSGLPSQPAVDGTGNILDGIDFGDGMLGDLLKSLSGSSELHIGTPIDMFSRLVSPTRLFATAFRDIEGLSSKALEGMTKAGQAAKAASAAPAALPATLAGAGLGGGGVTGGLGKAASIGAMSVPQTWTAAGPTTASPATLQVSGFGGAAAAEPGSHTLSGLPMTGAGGRSSSGFAAPRYGFRPTVIPHPPAGG